jgi:AraC-like DNA-binding protein
MAKQWTSHLPFSNAAPAASIIRYLESRQVDAEPVLRGLGIDPAAVQNPYERIPLTSLVELIDQAATLTGNDQLGLELGAQQDPANCGPVGFLLLNAPTVWSCLTSFQKVMGLWQSATHASVRRQGNMINVEYCITHPLVRRRDQNAEFALSFIYSHLKRIAPGIGAPLAVTFMHAQKGESAKYLRHFGTAPGFGAAVNALVFEASVGDLPNENADPRLFQIVSRHLDDLSKQMPHHRSLVQAVEDAVRIRTRTGDINLHQVSNALGFQPRALQRGLEAAGTGFSAIVAQVRLEEAIRYLEEDEIEVKELAYYVGFSDPSAFVKAFKRWTGRTPGQYRLWHRRSRDGAPSPDGRG